jgi:hypothetical protein
VGIFIVIWYIFPRFGILYEEKSGNPDFDCHQGHPLAMVRDLSYRFRVGDVSIITNLAKNCVENLAKNWRKIGENLAKNCVENRLFLSTGEKSSYFLLICRSWNLMGDYLLTNTCDC